MRREEGDEENYEMGEEGVRTLKVVFVWDNMLKRRGCSVVNLFPREVPRVLNLFPRGD